MDFYSILISVLRRFPGCVFVNVSVVHGTFVVRGGVPTHPQDLDAEEGGETGGPPPTSFVVNRTSFIILYPVYAVHGSGDGGK